jgi:hypothetical protein
MNDEENVGRPVQWREYFPWLMLTRTFRIATGLHVLLLAAAGALATAAGWRIVSMVALTEADRKSDTVLGDDVRYLGAWPGNRDPNTPVCPFGCAWMDRLAEGFSQPPPSDPLLTVPYRIVAPFARLLGRETTDSEQLTTPTWRRSAYYLVGGIWTLLVWSAFGGAITRMAALQFARDERTELKTALTHARSKVGAHLAALLLPLAFVLLLAIPIIVLGFVMRIDVGAALGGILWFLVLAVAMGMAVIVVGLLFGWPLMWGAINTESSDSFDAISRSYAYTFQKPLTYLGYLLWAALIGLLGWLLVWIVSELVVNLSAWSAALGAGRTRMDKLLAAEMPGNVGSFGARVMGIWNGVVYTLASAYAYSYFFCAVAGIYLLMRRDVDATELDQVFSADPDSQRFGLPPLHDDASGVPVVRSPAVDDGDAERGTDTAGGA